MIRNPIDIASRVSPELSGLIDSIINQLETDEPVTLGAVRSFVGQELPPEFSEAEEIHHFDDAESLVDELDMLIDMFGESAPAVDFVYAFASEQLSRVIEEVVNQREEDFPATLDEVRNAVLNGLGGRLVGEGILEDYEDDTLMPEIENLIGRFGGDAPAEDFLRYE